MYIIMVGIMLIRLLLLISSTRSYVHSATIRFRRLYNGLTVEIKYCLVCIYCATFKGHIARLPAYIYVCICLSIDDIGDIIRVKEIQININEGRTMYGRASGDHYATISLY